MPGPFIREACVETLEESVLAQEHGADRLELCSNLDMDGLTPPEGLIISVVAAVNIPVKVMLRPRAGDFTYSREEQNEIVKTAIKLSQLPVAGVVFGAIRHARLDIELIKRVADACMPLPVTVHKAIDLSSDSESDIKALKEIAGVDSVLTSGGATMAIDGVAKIRAMQKVAVDDINIIAAGRITAENVEELHRKLGLRAYHGRRIV